MHMSETLIPQTAIPNESEVAHRIRLSQTRYVKVDVEEGVYDFVHIDD